MDGGEGQPVRREYPEDQHDEKHQGQQPNFGGGDGENVANQVFIVLGKAAAAQGGHEDAQGYGAAGKHADKGVRRLVGAAADEGEQQGEQHAESHRRVNGHGHAENAPKGNAGECGVAQGVGEEAHSSCDDHGGQQPEQRRHQQQRQQGVFHKVPAEHFQGEGFANGIPEAHRLPPFIWKTSRKARLPRTSPGVPAASTV